MMPRSLKLRGNLVLKFRSFVRMSWLMTTQERYL
ncbi:hypothetical protein M002_30080 [Pseudomonas aeruginosa ID4365]|nr:hypothetical protein M002_30080 [Pseudomonas aeruginosa ID4365]